MQKFTLFKGTQIKVHNVRNGENLMDVYEKFVKNDENKCWVVLDLSTTVETDKITFKPADGEDVYEL